MAFVLLVPGRITISIGQTPYYFALSRLVSYSYTINGGLKHICYYVLNTTLLLCITFFKLLNSVLFDPQLLWKTEEIIQKVVSLKWFPLLFVLPCNSCLGSSQCSALSIPFEYNLN